jgi:hypothetical protein
MSHLFPFGSFQKQCGRSVKVSTDLVRGAEYMDLYLHIPSTP